METMILNLEKVDFEMPRVNKAFPIGGVIYVSLGELCFPAEKWHDLISVDLERWLTGLISFSLNHTDTCMLPFMDGPYAIKIQREENGAIVADCLWDSKVVLRKIIDFVGFLKSVLKCVRRYNRV